jgi:hypothetical protein
MAWMQTIALESELDELTEEVAPALVALQLLERLVTEEDFRQFDGECLIHEGCRTIR